MYCHIVLNSRSKGIGNGLTYESGDLAVRPGMLVLAPMRNQKVEGIVMSCEERQTDEAQSNGIVLKNLLEILHPAPLLTQAQMETARWISTYYRCPLYGACKLFLPGKKWMNLLPPPQRMYRLVTMPQKMSPKQRAIIAILQQDVQTRESLLALASSASIATLVKQGAIAGYEEHEHNAASAPSANGQQPTLSPLQQRVYEEIRKSTKPSLLFGVTASGKTEIYAELIRDAMKEGKQSILLLPEIFLTEHLVERFAAIFGQASIAILHSRIGKGLRTKEWRRIASGEAILIMGPRSALFAPVKHLGLIIIDEEHEWTLKSEQSPRYHARETAQTLAQRSDAKLVLGSATPSVESWARAKDGTYSLLRLPERFGGKELPTVRVIDLKDVRFGKMYPFSPALIAAIQQRLDAREQCVLFLNHRGSASAMLCLGCRRRLTSPATNLPFTVHTRGDLPYLLDHISGLRADIPTLCPHCGGTELIQVGAGTQGVEKLLATLFPAARVLRADGDTLQRPNAIETILQTMADGDADILLGTQSVVKGLHLPGITLAAVLVADVGLSLPHFRAGERVFSLLSQLTGRSGRGKPGEVIIQTFRPMAAEIVAAAQHRTEDFLNAELAMRASFGYPPAAKMVRLIFRGPHAQHDAGRLQLLLELRSKELTEESGAYAACPTVITKAPTLMGGGKEWHIILRKGDIDTLLDECDLLSAIIDVDPIECL